MAVTLVTVGLLALVWFAILIWPPLALLLVGAVLVAAGLLVDWGELRGKPARPPHRKT